MPSSCRQGSALVPAALLLLAAALLLGVDTAPNTDERQQEYIVVFKRGFDASKVRALCNADRDAALGSTHLQGLCRRQFSSLLNGFAGEQAKLWHGEEFVHFLA